MTAFTQDLLSMAIGAFFASGITTVLIRRYFTRHDTMYEKMYEIGELKIKLEDLEAEIRRLSDVINKKVLGI